MVKAGVIVTELITKVTAKEFRDKSAGRKIILLYPWTNYRNLFLSYFLSDDKNGLLYYRINDAQTTISEWLNGMVAEFDTVLGGFGSNIKALNKRAKPQDMAEALAADLTAYSKKAVLYVDELDRLPFDNNFDKFISALVVALPKGVQVAFSSRLLNYEPWYNYVAKGEAVVLGTERRKDDVIFTVEPVSKPRLEVYSLGRGYAIVNGQPITNWDGALPRNLFFYFMEHPLVTRDEIFETFWPDLSVKEATNVFHVTKRKISERISLKIDPESTFELTQYSGGFYMPSEKLVRHYDVSDFKIAVEKAMSIADDDEEEKLLMQAIELYKSPFLETIDMDWVVSKRDTLRQLNAQALISMGRLNKRRGNLEGALGFFVRSLHETPEREDIHREVMNLYLQMGMEDDARAQYKQLAEILHQLLGIGPSRESKELYEMIGKR